MYDYSRSGMPVTILGGAYSELRRLGWDGCENPKRDFERGTIVSEYGIGRKDHHIGVKFDDGEEMGFPPNFVKIEE